MESSSSPDQSLAGERTWTPQLPLTAHTSSILTQDVTFGDKLDLHLSGPSSVTLFANPYSGGQIEALVISAEKELKHLKRSATGWVLEPLVSNAQTKAKEVVATVGPDGSVYAHYIKAEGADVDRLAIAYLRENGSWQHSGFGPTYTKDLKVIYTSATPMRAPIVYGLNPRNDKELMISQWAYSPNGGHYRTQLIKLPDQSRNFAGCEIALYPIVDDTTLSTDNRSFRLFSRPISDYLIHQYIVHGNVFPSPATIEYLGGVLEPPTSSIVTAGAIDRLIVGLNKYAKAPFKGQMHVVGTFKKDKDLKIYSAEVTGVAFNKAIAWFDSETLMHIYGIDDAGVISVLRQTGWETETVSGPIDEMYRTFPVWTQAVVKGGEKTATNVAVPVEKEAALFFVDAHPDSSPTLFVVKKNGDIVLSTQDFLTGQWWTESVRLAPTAVPLPHPITCYRTQVSLVDASGIPLANYPMRVTANSLVQVRIAGIDSLLAPGAELELKTDTLGRATFCTMADSITTPSLVLSAAGLASGLILRPDGPIQDYLAGRGSLPLREKLTGKVLEQSALVPSWKDRPTPDQVVKSFQDVFSIAAGTPPPNMAGFVIQTHDASRPTYEAFTTTQDLNTAWQLHSTHASYAGWLEELKNILSDLWKGIVAGAVKVASFAVDVASKTFRLIIKLGDKLIELGRFIIQSFKDAADAVMAVFNSLDAKMEDVVKWLRALFNFKDIWETKSALDNDALKRLPDYIRTTLLTQFPPSKIKDHLTVQRSNLFAALETFTKKFPGKTLQDLNGQESISPSRLLAPETVLLRTPQGTVRRSDMDGPQANWLSDALMPFATLIPQGPVESKLEPIWTELQAVFKGLDYSFDAEFKEKFNALFDVNNPGSLGTVVVTGIVDILKWVFNKIFDILIALVDIGYKLIDQTMQYLHELTNTPVQIPPLVSLVDWIYKQATVNQPDAPPPPPLTLGGLISLVFAFPATLTWKLAAGDANSTPFPGGKLPHAGQANESVTGEAGNACLLVGGTIQTLYTTLDIANDMGSTPFTAIAAILAELYMPILIWPTADGIPFSTHSTEPDITQAFRWLNWVPGIVYLASDSLFFLGGASGKKELARDAEPVGQVILWLFGTLNLIAGVAESATVKNVTAASVCANILSPLSPAAQLLRLLSGGKPGQLLAVKLCTNVLSDAGGGFARVAAACGR